MHEYTRERFVPSEVTRCAFRTCAAFDYRRENVYLWSSGPGTGKSHLAVVAARRWIEAGVKGRVVKPNEIFAELRACFDDDARERDRDVLARLVDLPVLVVDDLGVSKDTEWNLAILYELLDGRYWRRPAGLVVTSNLSLAQVGARWGERIASRLVQMTAGAVYDLNGEPDHRLARS